MKTLFATALLAVAATAQASTLTFDDLSNADIVGDTLSVTVDGVSLTFSGNGLTLRDFDAFGIGLALSTNNDAGPITVTFGGGYLANNVAFNNPLYIGTSEVDNPIGTAYDIGGTVIASVQSGANLHFIAGPGIASVVYTEGSPGEGFVMGDFQFNVAPPVPEPATWAFMAMGLGLLALRRRA